MTHVFLYRYPFDEEGRQTLTFAESLAAMRELQRQLDAMLPRDWRWCDLLLRISERHPTYVIYEVKHYDDLVGRAVVMPYCAEPPRIGPGSTLDAANLRDRVRVRHKPDGA